MKKGILCISFDVEFEWGRKHLTNYPSFIPRIKEEERIIEILLNLFKKYHMPVTWAVVGAIFQEKKHLIEAFLSGSHEVASHSFSHLDFKKISEAEAHADLQQVIRAAKKSNVQLSSFVFPFNNVNHISTLKEYGFTTYRGNNAWYFPSVRRLGKIIPRGFRFKWAKITIDRAVKNGETLHLWTHPIDFVDNEAWQLQEFEMILRYAQELREKKILEIRTMQMTHHNV